MKKYVLTRIDEDDLTSAWWFGNPVANWKHNVREGMDEVHTGINMLFSGFWTLRIKVPGKENFAKWKKEIEGLDVAGSKLGYYAGHAESLVSNSYYWEAHDRVKDEIPYKGIWVFKFDDDFSHQKAEFVLKQVQADHKAVGKYLVNISRELQEHRDSSSDWKKYDRAFQEIRAAWLKRSRVIENIDRFMKKYNWAEVKKDFKGDDDLGLFDDSRSKQYQIV